eukprot:1236317-Amphidinium_carterae.1
MVSAMDSTERSNIRRRPGLARFQRAAAPTLCLEVNSCTKLTSVKGYPSFTKSSLTDVDRLRGV